ncbi:MAG: hypothetical protein U5L45_23430 [Saprospiraceae bacterium]|nr:hypothetical protein [Saprospiraceae bacterium]
MWFIFRLRRKMNHIPLIVARAKCTWLSNYKIVLLRKKLGKIQIFITFARELFTTLKTFTIY